MDICCEFCKRKLFSIPAARFEPDEDPIYCWDCLDLIAFKSARSDCTQRVTGLLVLFYKPGHRVRFEGRAY